MIQVSGARHLAAKLWITIKPLGEFFDEVAARLTASGEQPFGRGFFNSSASSGYAIPSSLGRLLNPVM